jgi:predicted  nucleic acid-binding Zn-ribbon protein
MCPICLNDRLGAQQQEIDRLETLSDAYEEKTERLDAEIDRLAAKLDAQQKEIECYRLRSLSAEKGWIQVTNERVEKIRELTAGNAKLKQDIEHLHGQGGLLFERIAGLEKANKELTTKLNNLYELSCTEDSSKLGRDLVYSMRINEATLVQAKDPIGVIAYIFDSIKDQFYKKVQALKGEKP